jgi:hypothetical protein
MRSYYPLPPKNEMPDDISIGQPQLVTILCASFMGSIISGIVALAGKRGRFATATTAQGFQHRRVQASRSNGNRVDVHNAATKWHGQHCPGRSLNERPNGYVRNVASSSVARSSLNIYVASLVSAFTLSAQHSRSGWAG